MTTNDLSFPIVVFDDEIGAVQTSKEEWESSNAYGLRLQHKVGAELIDQVGVWTRVTAIKFRAGRGRFGGYNLLFDRDIWVDLELEHLGDLTLDEVRERVLKAGTTGVNRKAFRAAVAKAESIPEIIDLLGY